MVRSCYLGIFHVLIQVVVALPMSEAASLGVAAMWRIFPVNQIDMLFSA